MSVQKCYEKKNMLAEVYNNAALSEFVHQRALTSLFLKKKNKKNTSVGMITILRDCVDQKCLRYIRAEQLVEMLSKSQYSNRRS